MKVEVETQPHSVATLRIELPPDEVRKEWDSIANNYARYAKIPGYRPGKAPKPVIERKFRKEIQDEVTKKLVSKSYHEAVAEKQLRVVSLTNLEDVEFGDDRSMRFRATVLTAPEFELPEYKGIEVQLPSTEVTEFDVDEAIERLREQSADFTDVPERPLALEDFAVIDFDGSIGGVPISELAPNASKNLQGGKKFWLRVAADNFLPGFVDQIVGMNIGQTRSVQVEFPAEFPVPELAGKKADYAVTLNEIKQKVLPELNDEFAAKLMPGKTLHDLRHTLEHNIEHEKEHEVERANEQQVVRFLHERISFDLPPALLKNETRRALNELVHRNRERGVPDEMLKDKEKELIEGAGSLAAHRLKTNFILHRIAERENIKITRDDVDERIREEAARYNMPVDKMRKELEQNDRIDGLAEELLLGKTLDFLKSNATVQASSSSPAEGASPE
ncbi:MAG TPA: trigger factor [Chthoniobacterales bacterium]|nr:trigger factor [Chthoniobacterales bacterium]